MISVSGPECRFMHARISSKIHEKREVEAYGTNLGKVSASSRTTSRPSRARTVAAYDPAGPPPTTKILHWLGIMAKSAAGAAYETKKGFSGTGHF